MNKSKDAFKETIEHFILFKLIPMTIPIQVSKKKRKVRKKKALSGNKLAAEGRPNQLPDGMENADDVVSCPESAMRKEETDRDPPSNENPDIHLPDGPNTAVDSDLGHNKVSDDPDDQNYATDDDSDDDDKPETNEVDLSVSNILLNFANNAIIQRLCWLLRFYKSNPENVNNYVISMLQRISDDLDLSPMLYQVKFITRCLLCRSSE